jgi:hypothetical protein
LCAKGGYDKGKRNNSEQPELLEYNNSAMAKLDITDDL